MKTIAAILLLSCLYCHPCFAFEPDPWTKTDTALQATYTVLHVIDWGQTASRANNGWQPISEKVSNPNVIPERREATETNPILGPKPSPSSVHIYFASSLIIHTVVSYVLPKPWRNVWQGAGIGIEACAIGSNYNLGVKGFF